MLAECFVVVVAVVVVVVVVVVVLLFLKKSDPTMPKLSGKLKISKG